MYRRVISEVATFGVDVVGGREEGETEDEASVTERRDPNRAHPGGYSRRDASSWKTSYGWGSQSLDKSGSGAGRDPRQVCFVGESRAGGR